MAGLIRHQRVLNYELNRRRGEARFGALVGQASDLIVVLDPDGDRHLLEPVGRARARARPARQLRRPTTDRARLDAGARRPRRRSRSSARCSAADGEPREFELRLTNLTRRGARRRHPAQRPRRLRAQGVRGRADAPGVPRRGDRARQPRRCSSSTRARRSPAGAASGATLAVLFLDLDDFKEINDSLGHAVGDEVLIAVARRLDGAVRGVDTAARFGGDEFAVLLEDVDSQARRGRRPARPRPARRAGRAPAGARSRCARASASRSRSPGDPRTAEELIRDADAAMYTAKRDGKGGYRLFEPAMHADVLARLELRSDLERAIDGRRARAALPAGRPARRRLDRRASRRCCAGTTPSAGWSRRSSSSRSPRRPG